MRIAFFVIGNSRRSNYLNGDTIRSGGAGASGTDSSNILVAEFLASKGHEVVVCTENLEPLIEKDLTEKGIEKTCGEKVRGVIYTDTKFTNIDNKNFDFLITQLWFENYESLDISVNKGIIYWCHMQWIYGIDSIRNFAEKNNVPVGFVHISEWEKSTNQSIVNVLKNQYGSGSVFDIIIPNPIMLDVIDEVREENIVKKNNKFIFHASWARGGNVAFDYLKKSDIEDWELHAFDYLMTIANYDDDRFVLHNGVDKITLFRHLAESEYFLYPLYTPYQDVHKDTFSCVVAEAIALGCTPITYPLGALPENFEGFCQWIDLPDGIDLNQIQSESLTKDETGLFKNNDFILDILNNLDTLDSTTGGYDFIKQNFSIDVVGNSWDRFLKSF